MKKEITEELIKSIEIAKDSFKNSMEVSFESYVEVISKLDLMLNLIMYDKKNKV